MDKINLYEQLSQEWTLLIAYDRIWMKWRKGHDTPGLDGMQFEDIEKNGDKKFILDIQKELEEQRYTSWPLRSCEIPKPSGGIRILGIPTVRDRIVQRAALEVLGPIFDPLLSDTSVGFRPGIDGRRRMIETVKSAVRRERVYVAQSDIASAFDSVPHEMLLDKLSAQISNSLLLSLVEKWIELPICDGDALHLAEKFTGLRGMEALSKVTSPRKIGVAQGSPLSPLFLNITMNDVDKSMESCKGISYSRYADDIVICASSPDKAQIGLERFQQEIKTLGMEIQPSKTKITDLRLGAIQVMGYAVRMAYWRKGDCADAELYLNIPEKAVERLHISILEHVSRYVNSQGAEPGFDMREMVNAINRVIQGFRSGYQLADKYEKWGGQTKAILGAAREAGFMKDESDVRICNRLVRNGLHYLQPYGMRGVKRSKELQELIDRVNQINQQERRAAQ